MCSVAEAALMDGEFSRRSQISTLLLYSGEIA